MVKIHEFLIRLKHKGSDEASARFRSDLFKFAEEGDLKLEILDHRLVFEFGEEWKKRKKKPLKKKKKSARCWAPVQNALWYNKKAKRYLFETKLVKLFSSKRKASIAGWRFLGTIESDSFSGRALVRKLRYGFIPKGMIIFATKNKKVLKYSAWA